MRTTKPFKLQDVKAGSIIFIVARNVFPIIADVSHDYYKPWTKTFSGKSILLLFLQSPRERFDFLDESMRALSFIYSFKMDAAQQLRQKKYP